MALELYRESMKLSREVVNCYGPKLVHLGKKIKLVSPGIATRPVGRGVSKGEEDVCRPPVLRAGHPPTRRKAVWGVARPQGV
jgi:hypothetical protein